MFAVLFALKSFRTLTHGKIVKVVVDNTTTESTIKQMDTSHSPKPNKIHGISASSNVYGLLSLCEKVEADKESSTFWRCSE